MKPKSIGIVGGAGPMAGAALLERVINFSGSLYGCNRNADFPKVFLLSFPFSEMLKPGMDVQQIRMELRGCLSQLRRNGADVLAIACNTLHAFLDDNEDLTDLIHMPLSLQKEIPTAEVPLVLCTSTSVQFGLHKRYFPCVYPSAEAQLHVDEIIDRILEGAESEEVLEALLEILKMESAQVIVLGCTELSLYSKQLKRSGKSIVDPLDIVAKNIVEKCFLKGWC